MRPYAVGFAPEADDQLEALFLHIAGRTSVATAARYLAAVVHTCERLAMFPHRGVPRDDIRPGLRVTHHKGRTIVAYAVDDVQRRATILGVFYGGQDYESKLSSDVD